MASMTYTDEQKTQVLTLWPELGTAETERTTGVPARKIIQWLSEASGYSPNLIEGNDLTAWDLLGFISASTVRSLYGGLALPVPRYHAPLVYVVSSGDLIKIGYTTHLYSRLAVLQSTTGQEITLEAVVPGSRELERQLHVRFGLNRVRGEWFRRSESLNSLIAILRQELPIR